MQIAERVRAHAGLRSKLAMEAVAEVFGPTDWVHGPGDDGAIVGAGLVVGGEAMAPAFAERDPYGAGVGAVVANVNDLAAMGALPLAIVDTVVGRAPAARAALAGMRDAGRLYDVPIVGGHLTVHEGPTAVSAFGLGRLPGPALAAANAASGQSLLLACVTEGRLREDFPFFPSFDERGGKLAGDVRTLAAVAESGAAVAAKDVSMAGLVGSAAMLCEARRLGVTIDVDAVPRPAEVDVASWLTCFPCCAFLLCAPGGREDECAAPFVERGMKAAIVGVLDGSGVVALRRRDEIVTVLDLAATGVTGLRPLPPRPTSG